MSSVRLTVLGLSAAALMALAGQACAQPEAAGVMLVGNDFAASNYAPGPVTTGRTLEWDSRKGRWGLKLGVEQHTDRLTEWHDVQPGVYFKLTPRLHIGGAVSLAPVPQVDPYVVDPRPTAPRVRLETTFKF
jgi:hypothetical protein